MLVYSLQADDSFLHKGCATKFCYEKVWDEYMNMVQPFASQIPYMTAPGNHEAECHGTNTIDIAIDRIHISM